MASSINIPIQIRDAAETEAAKHEYHDDIFLAGVEWLFAHLLASAPEFDEAAAKARGKASAPMSVDNGMDEQTAYIYGWLHGEREQNFEMAAQVQALRAENADLQSGNLPTWKGEYENIQAVCARLEDEIERLRAERDQYRKWNDQSLQTAKKREAENVSLKSQIDDMSKELVAVRAELAEANRLIRAYTT